MSRMKPPLHTTSSNASTAVIGGKMQAAGSEPDTQYPKGTQTIGNDQVTTEMVAPRRRIAPGLSKPITWLSGGTR